jgi:hypothetical protein
VPIIGLMAGLRCASLAAKEPVAEVAPFIRRGVGGVMRVQGEGRLRWRWRATAAVKARLVSSAVDFLVRGSEYLLEGS